VQLVMLPLTVRIAWREAQAWVLITFMPASCVIEMHILRVQPGAGQRRIFACASWGVARRGDICGVTRETRESRHTVHSTLGQGVGSAARRFATDGPSKRHWTFHCSQQWVYNVHASPHEDMQSRPPAWLSHTRQLSVPPSSRSHNHKCSARVRTATGAGGHQHHLMHQFKHQSSLH
jgi:hypothetical protein